MAVTERSMRAALKHVLRTVEKRPEVVAVARSAGYIFAPGQKRGHREGIQVFVKACQYSDDLLAKEPDTGGLKTAV